MVLFYRNYCSLMLHLYYFESLKQHGNLLSWEINPNMLGIQRIVKKILMSVLNTKTSLMLDDCFEIWR